MLTDQKIRLKVLANINLIGFPIVTLALIVVTFVQSLGWGYLLVGASLIFMTSFIIVGLTSKKSLLKINVTNTKGVFLSTLFISILPCMAVEKNSAIVALGIMVLLMAIGYIGVVKIKNPFTQLEILNYIGLVYLVLYIIVIATILG